MMNNESQLKLQAYLDGELSEAEARTVANWMAQDREAVALFAELRQTRQAMSGFEAQIRLPESREFYWSKIRREIERLEPAPAPQRAHHSGLVPFLRRILVPLGGLAVVVLAGLLVIPHGGGASRLGFASAETALADTGAFSYRDFSSGTTLVWVSYPAEKEFAGETDFDSLD